MKNKFGFIGEIIASLLLTFSVIAASVEFTLIFRPLYYFDISYLSIENFSGMSRDKILSNFNYTIKYVLGIKGGQYNLPSLPSSTDAQIHFYEVRQIFVKMIVLLIISLLLLILYKIFVKFKARIFLWSSITLFLTTLMIIIPSLINFSKFFDFFHRITFSNGYWSFDPRTDPIINILPEEFFFHCALLILSLCIVSSFVLFIFYKRKKSFNSLKKR